MSTQTSTPVYKRLRDREIRLVSIVAAEPCEPLRCELKTVSLDDGIDYDALSYVWGNLDLESEIHINDCLLPMPKNLTSALRFVRSLVPGRWLWVDQICIDQQNTEEKNLQVCLMSDIYRKAQKTFAYLNPIEDNPQFQKTIDTLADFAQHSIAGLSKPSAPVCLAFLKFLRHEWWTRVWTAQEMILAQDLIFIYMQTKIPYSTMATMFDVLTPEHIKDNTENNTSDLEDSVNIQHELVFRLNDYLKLDWMRQQVVNLGQVNDLVGLLSISRDRKATKLVDKVYGLAGLYALPPEFVDYRLSAKTCFEKLALLLIQRTQTLDVFNHIYHDPIVTRSTDPNFLDIRAHGASGPNFLSDLPSWVPDLTKTLRPGYKDIFQYRSILQHSFAPTGPTTPVHIIGHKHGKLTVVGVQCGVVDEVEDLDVSSHDSTRDRLSRWTAMDGVEEVDHSDTVYEEFREALTVGVILQFGENGCYVAKLDKITGAFVHNAWLSNVVGNGNYKSSNNVLDQVDMYAITVDAFSVRRCFIRTQTGDLGWAPVGTRPGDIVCGLFGSRTLSILHEVVNPKHPDKWPGKYKLLGDAYLHGYMLAERFRIEEMGKRYIPNIFKLA